MYFALALAGALGGERMDVRNCKGCGRLFNYYGGVPLCKACKDKLEEKFQEVKRIFAAEPEYSDTGCIGR